MTRTTATKQNAHVALVLHRVAALAHVELVPVCGLFGAHEIICRLYAELIWNCRMESGV